MGTVEQFSSIFKAATREPFTYVPPTIRKVLIVVDLQGEAAGEFTSRSRAFLSTLETPDNLEWPVLSGDDFQSVGDLLEKVEANRPDLVVTYRHLHSNAWQWHFSLGEHLDVLTQATSIPVMVMPHPQQKGLAKHALHNTNQVMAVTDHMAGDHRLVSAAARFTQPGGTLHLAHVEDETVFARYIGTISKIAEIDTDMAKEEIQKRLLKEPHDYIASSREVLGDSDLHLNVKEVVMMGHHLSDYRQLVVDSEIDLLLMNTKDDEQMAMHGMAHPLAVELKTIPLLLL